MHFLLLLLLLLLLFFWTPAHTVWPNYDMVLLQPRSRTTLSLGFVVNIMFYLNSTPSFNCLLDIFLPSFVPWPPPPSATLRIICTAFSTPNYPSSIPVLDSMSTWAGIHSRRTPTPVLLSLSCRPQPAPQVPLGPCSPVPWEFFLPPLSPFFRFPSVSLDVASVRDNPWWCSHLGSAFLRHVLDSPPPPAVLNLGPGPCWYWGG